MGLFATWTKAEGTVLARREVAWGPHGIAVRFAYVVEVRPAGEAPFRAEVKDPFFNGNFCTPHPGASVGVEYDAKTRKVRFDTADPRTNQRKKDRAAREEQAARFRDKLRGG